MKFFNLSILVVFLLGASTANSQNACPIESIRDLNERLETRKDIIDRHISRLQESEEEISSLYGRDQLKSTLSGMSIGASLYAGTFALMGWAGPTTTRLATTAGLSAQGLGGAAILSGIGALSAVGIGTLDLNADLDSRTNLDSDYYNSLSEDLEVKWQQYNQLYNSLKREFDELVNSETADNERRPHWSIRWLVGNPLNREDLRRTQILYERIQGEMLFAEHQLGFIESMQANISSICLHAGTAIQNGLLIDVSQAQGKAISETAQVRGVAGNNAPNASAAR